MPLPESVQIEHEETKYKICLLKEMLFFQENWLHRYLVSHSKDLRTGPRIVENIQPTLTQTAAILK